MLKVRESGSFLKKRTKKLLHLCSHRIAPGSAAVRLPQRVNSQSFLLLFFKKEGLSCLPFVLGLLAGAAQAHAQEAVRSVTLQGPQRQFGYLVGDVLSTDAFITAVPGTMLDMRSLPVPGPLNAAIELRRMEADQARDGSSIRVHIHADYQSFLAPDRVTETELPGYTVQLTTGTRHAAVHIPAWSFHVSPLRVQQRSDDDLAELRPDHAVPALPETFLLQRIAFSLLLAVAAALAFASGHGWLPGRRAGNRPFTVAARRIRSLSREGKDAAAVYQEIHRAFDATAGHHVFAGDLDSFITAHARFAPLHANIGVFFRASETVFFARNESTLPSASALLNLAKALSRLERRR